MIIPPKEAQQDSFRVQIQAARELDLPIIIHSRNADEDMASIIEEEYNKSPFKGVLHCFSSEGTWQKLGKQLI